MRRSNGVRTPAWIASAAVVVGSAVLPSGCSTTSATKTPTMPPGGTGATSPGGTSTPVQSVTGSPTPACAAGCFAYVSNFGSANVTVINTATNAVAATVGAGTNPDFVAIQP